MLEAGYGTGDVAMAKALAGAKGIVSSIDGAPEMIVVVRAKTAQLGVAVNYQVGLLEALAFPDHTFDVILSSLMMHHLPDDLGG